MYTAAKCEWNFSIYSHESISEEKIFTRCFIKIFSSEIHFTNQRSNIYWKWRKWLMWGDTKEEMNENLKTYVWFKTVISMTRNMKIVHSLYEWNVIMIVWMKLDCTNKLNNISRHTFRFLNHFDTFLSK